jgi:Short C-terminal domain/Phospholipase_D-nuclease N-terminal
MSFWDIIWFIIVSFAFIAYLMVMFSIIADLFRDQSTSGWAKAVWIVCLIFVPFFTSLVYLIARGGGMAERSYQSAKANQLATDDYVRQVAGSGSPADEIAKAKALHDSGAISDQEFAALKARVLGGAAVPAQGTSA